MASQNQRHSSPVTPLPPREFPSTGFEVIDPSKSVEEERLPFYNCHDYYPMRIGEVIKERYQVVAKLGYGTGSTVWLCHDLRERSYWVLKVHINTLKHNQELQVYRYLAGITKKHPGRDHIRRLEDSFTLKGHNGEHDVFVMKALGMSLRTLQDLQSNHTFQRELVVGALNQVLLGLDFLHGAEVIHTDLHSDNLLIALTNDAVLTTVENQEFSTPSARKQIGDTIIYVSRYMMGGPGPLVICDFGQARIGNEHTGNAMPVQYRTPEVILNMKWGNAVDMWSVGLLAWDLLEGESLFQIYDHESEEQNDAHHLAMMTALLGPPPPEFLNKNKETSKYWNEDGKWKGPVPLPTEKTLESLIQSMQSLTKDDKELFFDFVEGLLCWLPEERLTAGQIYYHAWLGNPGWEAILAAASSQDVASPS